MSFDKKKENWQNQTSSRQRSIEGDNFREIILAKSLKIPIENWTRRIEQDEEEEHEMPKILFLRSSFRRETVSRSSRVQLSPSKGSPDAWQSNFTSELQRDPMSFRGLFPSTLSLPLFSSLCLPLPPVICSRGFARLALIAGQTRGTLRSLDNLLDDRPNRAVFLGRPVQDGQWISCHASSLGG